MTRKEEITKEIERLENELYRVDSQYDLTTCAVGVYLCKRIKLNEQINELKEKLQELERENLIAPLNSAIATLKNYCYETPVCECCLIQNICTAEPRKWRKIE